MKTALADKKLLNAVLGHKQQRPPIWIMRQAGRYLPEYRQLRATTSGFLELCYSPKLACEVSLQPLRRFDLDAAILFSDILVIPDALGQKVRFEEGEGPVLEAITEEHIKKLNPETVVERLAPVLETLELIGGSLGADKTLIGFCGAPWTVATYMIGGRGSPDQAKARLFALQKPAAFKMLIDILVKASINYLVAQFKAGADVVQIFESWALNLDDINFHDYVIEPNRRIVAGVRAQVPDAPIIGFPRGAAGNLDRYGQLTGLKMLGLDYAVPLDFVKSNIDAKFGVQGNLDPLRLVAGGKQMHQRIEEIIEAFSDRVHIFNLGHGIVPQTPIENVTELVNRVKGS
ncbi:Uroporphyrinogen III decarboxylase [hydrothermal vent metagenome]|uniref:uroporphyrinogen decarboxylase n=1 Tax=hydrothermal vent metagenome TaxID=652676 RepID=A0A3B0TYN5_9ZZZZ